jgi:natural product precursor
MKKRNQKKLNLSKKSISSLATKELDRLKGGSAWTVTNTACNSFWDCNEK